MTTGYHFVRTVWVVKHLFCSSRISMFHVSSSNYKSNKLCGFLQQVGRSTASAKQFSQFPNDSTNRPQKSLHKTYKTINGLVSRGKFTGLSPRFYGKIYDTMVSCSFIHHFIIESISCTTKRLVDLNLALAPVSSPATIYLHGKKAGQNHPKTSQISFKPI